MAVFSEKNVAAGGIAIGTTGTLLSAFNIASDTASSALGLPPLGWLTVTAISALSYSNSTDESVFKTKQAQAPAAPQMPMPQAA